MLAFKNGTSLEKKKKERDIWTFQKAEKYEMKNHHLQWDPGWDMGIRFVSPQRT